MLADRDVSQYFVEAIQTRERPLSGRMFADRSEISAT
jgi:hypothetical protein